MAAPVHPLEILCRHAAASLPDSMAERKALLWALGKVLKPQHPGHRQVQAQLAALEAIEQLQRELPGHFPPRSKTP